ncbi:VIT and VWA domain-containing protein [Niveibacterium sp. 24ML]|uniref:VIT and vWA domain-containing protein n=1 Tax=Niveibacterium sp. 24ML TaxID=2985512 RepID=UPI00227161DC|nr:VIT and VWA domain-containing protein [Niveibacterium sp. 24ML]MCX9157788.1 VIT and VWA domain-containing protein [Niveibacterium sp. 24ML]
MKLAQRCTFGLNCDAPAAVPLTGVAVDAQLIGPLAVVELRQRWRHDGDRPIEATYTFPLAAEAQLMDLALTIGERRLNGTVQPRREAEAGYEAAIAEGQRAALVMDAGPDLKQIALGNLQPGDAIEVCLRWVEPLRWVGKQLRWRLPTVVAPRYGSPSEAGFAPWQAPTTSLLAHYAFDVQVRISGDLAEASLACPTHPITLRRDGGDMLVSLAREASLDRDFILNLVAEADPRAELWTCPTATGSAALLSFQPKAFGGVDLGGRHLVLLVDCSGSMGGDSIRQVKEGLLSFLALAREQDRVTLMRFGSSVARSNDAPIVLNQSGREQLARLVRTTVHADLGGTEILKALDAAIKVAGPEGEVLLITDGEAHVAPQHIAAVTSAGVRIFTVGVGSAVAEGLVRDLALRSQGACELVTPNESMAAVIASQCRRLSLPRMTAHLAWDTEPLWCEAPPAALFAGDTVLLGLEATQLTAPRLELRHEECTRQLDVITRSVPEPFVDLLRRYTAARRLPTLLDAEAQALAVREGLLCRHTAMIAIDTEKTASDGLPALVEVPNMLAAGWGGLGSVVACRSLAYSADFCADLSESPVIRRAKSAGRGPATSEPPAELMAFLRADVRVIGLVELLERIARHFDKAPPGSLDAARAELPLSWLIVLEHWVDQEQPDLDEQQRFACFVVAGLKTVGDAINLAMRLLLRRTFAGLVPAGCSIDGLERALADEQRRVETLRTSA